MYQASHCETASLLKTRSMLDVAVSDDCQMCIVVWDSDNTLAAEMLYSTQSVFLGFTAAGFAHQAACLSTDLCMQMQDRFGSYTAAVQHDQQLFCLLAGALPTSSSRATWPSSLWPIRRGMYIHHKAPCPQGQVQQHASARGLASALASSAGTNTTLLVARANIFCRIGQTDRALADLEHAQQSEPGNLALYRATAAIKVGLQEFASAMSDLNRADRQLPNTYSVISEQGIIHLHRGCFQVGLPSTTSSVFTCRRLATMRVEKMNDCRPHIPLLRLKSYLNRHHSCF